SLRKDSNNRLLLKMIGGVILGLGIWSMHFIGMLALNLNMPINYDLKTTIISIIPAVLASIFIIHF
ncbi:MAG: hypothetical protein JKY14_08400, partial [Paraglaciecola sp.]|nr:hypothetical protein [Paraglaciecola sp.]